METISIIISMVFMLFNVGALIYGGFNYTTFQAPPEETEKAKTTIIQSGLSLFIGMCVIVGMKWYSTTLETLVFYLFLGSYILFYLFSFYFFLLKERNSQNFIKLIRIILECLLWICFIQLVFFR